MALGLPLDSLFSLLAGGRFTTLNANPTVFTGPAIAMTAANATGVGAVALTVPDCAAGQYMPVGPACHTADRYADMVDTSATSKAITCRDNAAAAEATVSVFFLLRTAVV